MLGRLRGLFGRRSRRLYRYGAVCGRQAWVEKEVLTSCRPPPGRQLESLNSRFGNPTSTGVGDPVLCGRSHSFSKCSDSRARSSFFHFSVRRLAHKSLDVASLAPSGALSRHPYDGGRDSDAVPSCKAIYPQSGFRGFLFRVLVLAVGLPGAILSAPKLVCDRIRPLAAFGYTLAG
jgi:hypothetical protein